MPIERRKFLKTVLGGAAADRMRRLNSTPNPRNRWAAAAILLVAAALRLPLLDHRPMHADEAVLADKFGTLLATGAYPYDPHEYHGPMLARLAWIPAHLAGRTTYATLTETVLRLAPAAAGILLVAGAPAAEPLIGSTAANTAAALVAVSPAMVYYSRYFIPEMPLALATALFLFALTWRGRAWPAAAGAAAAFMIATKETAVLALAAAGLAYLAAFRPRPSWRAVAVYFSRRWRPVSPSFSHRRGSGPCWPRRPRATCNAPPAARMSTRGTPTSSG